MKGEHKNPEFLKDQVEELAWLVKDNLHAKHLVLSVEELFVEFLECPLSEEETLPLEPMESYQRMLLHRLADIFGLVHESVGEGQDRHLVVEKCEDSLIPAVLVSDVLLSGDGELQHPLLSRQLLKRNTTGADGFQSQPRSKNPVMSLEERQTVYLAARQRIFSEKWKYSEESSTEKGSVRPRANPVVAQRMIAHALGKPKVPSSGNPSTRLISAPNIDLQSLVGSVGDKSWMEIPISENMSVSGESKESMQQSSVKAAKRMFANALGLPSAGTSPRVSLQEVPCKTGTYSIPVQPVDEGNIANSNTEKSKNLITVPGDLADIGLQGPCTGERTRVTPIKTPRNARPGGAACKIFSQALGLPDPVHSSEVNRPTSIQ